MAGTENLVTLKNYDSNSENPADFTRNGIIAKPLPASGKTVDS